MAEHLKKVFLSYCWGPKETQEQFKESVWNLAGWLTFESKNKVKVISDHLHSVIPPVNGWLNWMFEEITSSDIVLIICTPEYKEVFEKRSSERNGGYGVTHEGCIISQEFYDGKGLNSKFYPITPDGGQITHVPQILKAYSNGLSFPSLNKKILDLILGKNPTHCSSSQEDTSQVNEMIDLEKQVFIDISEVVDEKYIPAMSFDVQILIRCYLSLSNTSKMKIISSFGETDSDFNDLSPFEKDKIFLSKINDLGKLNELWSEVNKIAPFENPNNPFNQ